MSLRSPDRDVLRRQALIQRVAGAFHFEYPDCFFRRRYATEQGAVNGAAAHLLQLHRVRLTLKAAS